MRLVNLTSHAVRLLVAGGAEVSIPPSGTVARIEPTVWRRAGVVDLDGQKIPAFEVRCGELQDLPERAKWTRYIVSYRVQKAACAAGRHDTLVPYHLQLDSEGRVEGAWSLQVCCYQAHVERQ